MGEANKRDEIIKKLAILRTWAAVNPKYGKGLDVEDCVAVVPWLDKAIEALKAREPITGETSDGYHTFNELYHHRAVLFSVIVANYPDRAWKSKKHNDGTMYDNMFIVGIDTPDGQATYHYDIDPYWDMFKCRVLDNAPEWDGHTPAQAIERIGKLKAQEPVEPKLDVDEWRCGNCGHKLEHQELLGDNVLFHEQYNYCPNCGQEVKWG